MLHAYLAHDDDWSAVIIARNFPEALAAWRSATKDEDHPGGVDPDSLQTIPGHEERVLIPSEVLGLLPEIYPRSWDSLTDGLWDRVTGKPRPGTLDAIRSQDFGRPRRLLEFVSTYPDACLSRLAEALTYAKSTEEVWQCWAAEEERAIDGFNEE